MKTIQICVEGFVNTNHLTVRHGFNAGFALDELSKAAEEGQSGTARMCK